MKADIDLDIGRKTFASGLLPELIAVLHRSRPGDLVAVVGDEESIGPELETWCRFTGNPLREATLGKGRMRWVFRCGAMTYTDSFTAKSAPKLAALTANAGILSDDCPLAPAVGALPQLQNCKSVGLESLEQSSHKNYSLSLGTAHKCASRPLKLHFVTCHL